MTNNLLTTVEAAEYLGMKKSYLHKLMMKRRFLSTNQTANCASLTRTSLINGSAGYA